MNAAAHITIIQHCKNAGRLLHPGIRSVAQSIHLAKAESALEIDWIIAVDTPCQRTESYLKTYLPDAASLVKTESGDIAHAINDAVGRSQSEFIALVDGFDLVSADWLRESIAAARKQEFVILHPATLFVSGGEDCLYIMPDQDDPQFSKDVLLLNDLWPGPSFARAQQFKQHAFVPTETDNGFGHSNWHWTCETVAAGARHKPVKDTFCCRRQSQQYDYAVPKHNDTVIPSSRLFAPSWLKEQRA